MNKSDNLLDPYYVALNQTCFAQRMNHYAKMIRWLALVNIVAWSAIAYIVIASKII